MKRLLVLFAAVLAASVLASGARAIPPPPVYVVNESSLISEPLLELTLPVFQRAVSEDFAPYWSDARLVPAAAWDDVPDGALAIALRDNSDVYGALGYHWVTARGPTAYAFVQTAVTFGYSWEVTFTHELFEMLADPWVDRAVWNGLSRLWLMEVADPVEAERYAYWRNDALGNPVQVSDFVTEQWYLSAGQPPFDFTRGVRRPQRVLPGGFAYYWRGGGWVEISKFRARWLH